MLLVETSSSFKEGSHGNNTSAVTSCFVVWLLRKKKKKKRGKERERERESVGGKKATNPWADPGTGH